MTKKIDLTVPTIHLNGSGRVALLRQYHTAIMATQQALVSLRELDIHDRDYYPQGREVGRKARQENQNRIDRLKEVLQELEQIYGSICP